MVRTIPNRARPRRRELLPRISSQEIQISSAAALTIGVGHLDIGRRVSRGKSRLKGSHTENF